MRLEVIEEIEAEYPNGYYSSDAENRGCADECPCRKWINCLKYRDEVNKEKALKNKESIDFEAYIKRFGSDFKMSDAFGNG